MLQGRVRLGLQATASDGVLVAVDLGEPWVAFDAVVSGGGANTRLDASVRSVNHLLCFEHWAVQGAVRAAEFNCVRDLLGGGLDVPADISVELGREVSSV